jgi:hypothetical protein
MRLDGVVGHSYIISGQGWNKEDLHLYLGYEDDHYKDNGYYRDSAGATGSQCHAAPDAKGHLKIPRAFVEIRVERPPTLQNVASFKPFDVVSSDVDPNGLLMDPSWGSEYGLNLVSEADNAEKLPLPSAEKECGSFPSLPGKRTYGFALCPKGCDHGTCKCPNPCSSQSPSFDYPIDLSLNKWISCFGNHFPVSLNGHANWSPVMYTGALRWENDQAFDEDADIILYRPAGNQSNTFDYSGFSASYGNEIEIEMASYETWDTFGTSPLRDIWQKHNEGDALGWEAQIIGLMSLDCVHGCKVELHPVFAMAIHLIGYPKQSANGTWDDRWALFARNWGNEGWCSHDQHVLDRDRIAFVLPGPLGSYKVETVTDPSQSPTSFNATAVGLSVVKPQFISGQGARVALILGDPSRRTEINGFLHVTWSAPLGKAAGTFALPAPLYKDASLSQPEAPEAQYGTPDHPETIESSPVRRTYLAVDHYSVSLLEPDNPIAYAPYMPVIATSTIEATKANKFDKSKLVSWCKQQAAHGISPNVCNKNTEPAVGKTTP